MMNLTENHIINEIRQTISKNSLTKNDVGILLKDCRRLIELKGQKDKFQVLNFYSNWSMHPDIDKNVKLFDLLERINIGFSEIVIPNSNSSNIYSDYIDVVIDTLDFTRLLNELQLLLISNGIIIHLGTQKRRIILNFICESLIFIRIHYPDSLNKKQRRLKEETLKKLKNLSAMKEQIKFSEDTKLSPYVDYATDLVINSLMVQKVVNYEVFIEMEIEHEKKIIILGSIKI